MCEGFESKGVISNYQSHDQDSGERGNFSSMVQIYEDMVRNRDEGLEKKNDAIKVTV